MAARTSDAQTRDWEHDWQDTVNETLKVLTAQQQQTAIALNGILTRLESIEKQPEVSRQRFSLANQGLGTVFGLAALIGEILQHITFH